MGAGVSGTVRSGLAQLSFHEWQLRPMWLVGSGLLYAIGIAPMAWFWNRTLAAMVCPTPILPTFRAYYLGQLGKYVPGKAMVVVLRVAAVRRWAPAMRIAILSVFLETLTMMAVGGLLAGVLSAMVLHLDVRVSLIAFGMAAAAGVPTLPFVARWAVGLRRGGQVREQPSNQEIDGGVKPPADGSGEVGGRLAGVTWRLLMEGWMAAAICWALLACSLGAMMWGIGVERISLATDWAMLVTAVAFSVVAGFVSMLPGGLGVRDAVLLQLLAPVCGDANALVAAVLLRLVWLVAEVVACGILYIGAGSRGQGAE